MPSVKNQVRIKICSFAREHCRLACAYKSSVFFICTRSPTYKLQITAGFSATNFVKILCIIITNLPFLLEVACFSVYVLCLCICIDV